MANTSQARKRARQNDTHRARNSAQRSTMRTEIKSFLKFIQAGDLDNAKAALIRATSKLDRAAKNGLAHKNQAARLKSRLNARLKKLATA